MNAKRKVLDSQKIDRTYRRQLLADRRLGSIEAALRLNHETDVSTIAMLTASNQSLEQDNQKLRRYLGKMLFERRQGIPTANIPVPTLTHAIVTIPAPAPSSPLAHVYDSAGKRCMRCSCLREANEASGTYCEPMEDA